MVYLQELSWHRYISNIHVTTEFKKPVLQSTVNSDFFKLLTGLDGFLDVRRCRSCLMSFLVIREMIQELCRKLTLAARVNLVRVVRNGVLVKRVLGRKRPPANAASIRLLIVVAFHVRGEVGFAPASVTAVVALIRLQVDVGHFVGDQRADFLTLIIAKVAFVRWSFVVRFHVEKIVTVPFAHKPAFAAAIRDIVGMDVG